MKLAICAGGTGGHIFPGIAVAEALTARGRGDEPFFIGATGGLEGRLIPAAGFRLFFIEAHQFLGQSPFYKALTLLLLLKGIFMSLRILRKERPQAIIGMGGFTCVPVILAGVLLRIPTFLHEQNVQPGLANKVLARLTRKTFTSFREAEEYLPAGKITHTGNPLRRKLTERKENGKTSRRETFGIFVFGGSRGARAINNAVIDLLSYVESDPKIVFYHQTGQDDLERVEKAYAEHGVPHEVFSFTDEMERYYGLSDVVISRAGATTIFELACFHKAAILIPYPYSAGGAPMEKRHTGGDSRGSLCCGQRRGYGSTALRGHQTLEDRTGAHQRDG